MFPQSEILSLIQESVNNSNNLDYTELALIYLNDLFPEIYEYINKHPKKIIIFIKNNNPNEFYYDYFSNILIPKQCDTQKTIISNDYNFSITTVYEKEYIIFRIRIKTAP
jgi:hypothetical protein